MRLLLMIVAVLIVIAPSVPADATDCPAPGPRYLAGGTTVFVLKITEPGWQSTGIVIEEDLRLMIRVFGEANTAGFSSSYPWVAWSGPGGLLGSMADENHLLPGVPRWSVIGRCGEGAPFYVGDGGILGGPGGPVGELQLGYNDTSWGFGDNFGYFLVYVMVAEPGPGPIASALPPLQEPLPATSRPNPTSSSAVIQCSMPAVGPVSIDIFDVGGRLVRSLRTEATRSGSVAAAWDGLDASGRSVNAGIYYYRVSQGSASARGEVVIVH